jgi:ribosomal protein S18 acetylase RimI-like enzyme
MAHRANLWGVYVRPEARGVGVARQLIEALLTSASGKVVQVHLSVVTGNEAALRLYRNAGFEVYGTEPRSLYVNGRYFDEHLMVRFLEGTEKVTDNE